MSYKKKVLFRCFLLLAASSPSIPLPAQIVILSTVQHDSDTPAGVTVPKAITPDGRFVVVASAAPNLVAGQELPTCGLDLFWLDTWSGGTKLATRHAGSTTRCTGGTLGYEVSISSDGRFVAFESSSPDLLGPGLDTNGRSDVFLYDSQLGTIVLVDRQADDPNRSVSLGGQSARLSASGDRVYFASASPASELVPGATDTNATLDTFTFDRTTGAISLVSHKAGEAGTAASGFSVPGSPTPDGRYVTIESNAPDLVSGYIPGAPDDRQLYRYDHATGAFVVVSHQAGQPAIGGNEPTLGPAELSSDGRFVAFNSYAGNLVFGQNGFSSFDVFLGDLATGNTLLVSAAAGSSTTPADDYSWLASLSPDGRHVLFSSDARNLVAGMVDDFFRSEDTFLFDRLSSTVELISRYPGTTLEAIGYSDPLGLSSDATLAFFRRASTGVWSVGRPTGEPRVIASPVSSSAQTFVTTSGAVVFASTSPDFTKSRDENGLADVFRLAPGAPSAELLTFSAGPSPRTTAGGFSACKALTPDGRFVLWTSNADFLFPGDTNHSEDAFVFDRRLGSLHLASPMAGQMSATAGSTTALSITPSGRYVLLSSCSPLLVAGTSGPPCQTYLHDRTLTQSRLVSHVAGQPLVGSTGPSTPFALSDDGRFVLFRSEAGDLVPGFVERNLGPDLFLYDTATGAATLVSHAAGQPTATGNGHVPDSPFGNMPPRLTPDGRFVLFTSTATDHGLGFTDPGIGFDVFLFDRSTGLIEPQAVTAADPSVVGAGGSLHGDLSPDGRFTTFASTSTDLVAGITDSASTLDAFVRDRQSGTTWLVSHRGDAPSIAAGGESLPSKITPDGRWILFQSQAGNLLPPPGPNPPNFAQNAFVYDRLAARAELVSQSAADPRSGGNADSKPTGITPTGRWVSFDSDATNLQTPVQPFVFGRRTYLFDRQTQRQTLLGEGVFAGLATDGNTVVWSGGSQTVSNDTNGSSDALVYSTEIFVDGFESGSFLVWSFATP